MAQPRIQDASSGLGQASYGATPANSPGKIWGPGDAGHDGDATQLYRIGDGVFRESQRGTNLFYLPYDAETPLPQVKASSQAQTPVGTFKYNCVTQKWYQFQSFDEIVAFQPADDVRLETVELSRPTVVTHGQPGVASTAPSASRVAFAAPGESGTDLTDDQLQAILNKNLAHKFSAIAERAGAQQVLKFPFDAISVSSPTGSHANVRLFEFPDGNTYQQLPGRGRGQTFKKLVDLDNLEWSGEHISDGRNVLSAKGDFVATPTTTGNARFEYCLEDDGLTSVTFTKEPVEPATDLSFGGEQNRLLGWSIATAQYERAGNHDELSRHYHYKLEVVPPDRSDSTAHRALRDALKDGFTLCKVQSSSGAERSFHSPILAKGYRHSEAGQGGKPKLGEYIADLRQGTPVEQQMAHNYDTLLGLYPQGSGERREAKQLLDGLKLFEADRLLAQAPVTDEEAQQAIASGDFQFPKVPYPTSTLGTVGSWVCLPTGKTRECCMPVTAGFKAYRSPDTSNFAKAGLCLLSTAACCVMGCVIGHSVSGGAVSVAVVKHPTLVMSWLALCTGLGTGIAAAKHINDEVGCSNACCGCCTTTQQPTRNQVAPLRDDVPPADD